jgi:predicted ester cyclase
MDLAAFYRRYNACCNEHRFDDLAEFVADEVEVDGSVKTRAEYARSLQDVIDSFPDQRWEIRHLLVDGDWIAAHFFNSGTHAPTGRPVQTQEFAFYRIADGRIAEVWGTADDLLVEQQLR